MPNPSHQPVKVAFTLPSFAAGGAERVLITLMNGLDRSRFDPALICLNKDGPLRTLVADDIPIHSDHNFSRVVSSLPYLLKTLWKLKPDIIVSTMAHMNFAVLLISPFLPRKTKIIVREAITPSYLLDTHHYGWLIRILYKALYPRAKRVICPAQCIIDEFESCVDMKTKNFALLYNPVNIDKIRAQQPAPSNDQPVRFICVGRLHTQKGFDRLIDALPQLSKDENWHLSILGEGEEQDALQKMIDARNLQNNVTLSGFSNAPWPEVANADCFLLPSRHEGLPNVALEALCVGTPVISTREAGGICEIAKLAAPDSITLCDTMEEFIVAMEKVQALPSKGLRESLLPATFHPDEVEKRFMTLLDQAA
jgi:glycosyltransferase involved in cell wall biosynthesis